MIRKDSSPIQPTLKLLKYFFGDIHTDPTISFRGTPCWLWITIPSKGGYGRFKAQGIIGYAHVIACRMFVGPIPEELSCDHLCKRQICANPAHIEFVPLRVNILRGSGPAAINAERTHCINGHEFTPESMQRCKAGRSCRICSRARDNQKRRTEGVPQRIKGLCYKRLHVMTPENSIIDTRNGNRSCRACKNIATKIRRQANRS